jgi:hypothetical protein
VPGDKGAVRTEEEASVALLWREHDRVVASYALLSATGGLSVQVTQFWFPWGVTTLLATSLRFI